jgi:hypothetical protein
LYEATGAEQRANKIQFLMQNSNKSFSEEYMAKFSFGVFVQGREQLKFSN